MPANFRENPFPYSVPTLDDLPESFRQAVQPWLKPDEPVVSILMLPPQPFLKRGGIPRQALLSTTHGVLHVRDRQPPSVVYLPGEALLYARHSLILLYGCLELAGDVNGELTRVVVEYHTLGEPLMGAILRRLLRLAYQLPVETGRPPENEALLDRLKDESYKFMSGLRLHALQPNERLLGYVFQPRITKPFLRFFNLPVAPNALLALSDQAVILIEEDKSKGAAYGWLVTLCPRQRVAVIDDLPNQEWRNVVVHLLRDEVRTERKVTVTNETALVWQRLWASRSVDNALLTAK